MNVEPDRVQFGFSRKHEPKLLVYRHPRWIHVHWGEVPLDCEAETKLTDAIERSGVERWMMDLFRDYRHAFHRNSTLTTGGYGCWTYCLPQVGEAVVDVLTVLIRQEMEKIIPTLGFAHHEN